MPRRLLMPATIAVKISGSTVKVSRLVNDVQALGQKPARGNNHDCDIPPPGGRICSVASTNVLTITVLVHQPEIPERETHLRFRQETTHANHPADPFSRYGGTTVRRR